MYNKYSNIRTEIDSITFDSKREAHRYAELKLLLRAKEIKNLILQPTFILQDKFFDRDGVNHRALTYVADFQYEDKAGNVWVEDCKGMKTDVYKIKKKLFLFKYPEICFVEV